MGNLYHALLELQRRMNTPNQLRRLSDRHRSVKPTLPLRKLLVLLLTTNEDDDEPVANAATPEVLPVTAGSLLVLASVRSYFAAAMNDGTCELGLRRPLPPADADDDNDARPLAAATDDERVTKASILMLAHFGADLTCRAGENQQ